MPVSRRLVYDAIATRLVTVGNAAGYYGQLGRPLTLTPPSGWVPDPVVKDEASGDMRVTPYFVVFPGAGTDVGDQPLCATDGGLGLDWFVTVAGGDVDDVLALLDRVDAALLGWAPTVTGHVFDLATRFPGSRSPIIPDRTVTPERLFARPQYALSANS